MSRIKVVVLVCSGMDSVTALYHAQVEYEIVGALSFEYGSKHNHKEIPLRRTTGLSSACPTE